MMFNKSLQYRNFIESGNKIITINIRRSNTRKKSSKNIIVSIQIFIEIQGIGTEFFIEKIKIFKKFAKLFLVSIFYNFGLKIFLKC